MLKSVGSSAPHNPFAAARGGGAAGQVARSLRRRAPEAPRNAWAGRRSAGPSASRACAPGGAWRLRGNIPPLFSITSILNATWYEMPKSGPVAGPGRFVDALYINHLFPLRHSTLRKKPVSVSHCRAIPGRRRRGQSPAAAKFQVHYSLDIAGCTGSESMATGCGCPGRGIGENGAKPLRTRRCDRGRKPPVCHCPMGWEG